MKLSLISILFIFICSFELRAKELDMCNEYNLGWHFYCNKNLEKEQKINPQDLNPNQDDYAQKLEQIKQQLEEKKAKAVIYPSEENIKNYMSYQQMVMDKSSFFADQWRRVLWKNPQLDYTLKRPVSKIAKESWIDQRNQEVKKSIKNINERYGIFFVFNSKCPHCHRYSPILKSFQEKYKITIMPVSLDGEGLKEWQNVLVNKNHLNVLGINIEAIPATILFDKISKKVIPLGFGVLSHSELEERIFALTKLEIGNDF